jgi:hypothetical protein
MINARATLKEIVEKNPYLSSPITPLEMHKKEVRKEIELKVTSLFTQFRNGSRDSNT